MHINLFCRNYTHSCFSFFIFFSGFAAVSCQYWLLLIIIMLVIAPNCIYESLLQLSLLCRINNPNILMLPRFHPIFRKRCKDSQARWQGPCRNQASDWLGSVSLVWYLHGSSGQASVHVLLEVRIFGGQITKVWRLVLVSVPGMHWLIQRHVIGALKTYSGNGNMSRKEEVLTSDTRHKYNKTKCS